MREQPAARSTDKGPNLGHNGVPDIGIDRGVVNAANQ